MSSFKFLTGSIELDNKPHAKYFSKIIEKVFSDCNGYFGYKLTSLGRDSDDESPTFICLTREFGILLIDVLEDKLISASAEGDLDVWGYALGEKSVSRDYFLDVFNDEIESRLKNEPSFYSRKIKKVSIPVSPLIVFPLNSQSEIESLLPDGDCYSSRIGNDDLYTGIVHFLSGIEKVDLNQEVFDKVVSLLEGTYVFEDKYKVFVEDELKTINSFIEKSLVRTFKQDEAQRIISLQIPDGPQRIRGLAGTGKTIVLSLKAAITHKRLRDYKILYLFNTQSLYGHITSYISKYYVSEAKRAPDFEKKLNVFHAWGGKQREGLYSHLCGILGLSPLIYTQVRFLDDPLDYIFRDLLKKAGDRLEPIYDMVLIDEAQDLPPSLFETVFKITKDPKRIVWAYDDFQSLRDMKIKEPEDLFGKKADGTPNIPNSALNGHYLGGIDKDFVLPNCYRTPRPVLMTAHGVAMGLYNKDKIMQPFDKREDWHAVGYLMESPNKDLINEGDEVVLIRPDENSKNKLEEIICNNGYKSTDLVNHRTFNNIDEEIDYIAKKIYHLINSEGVSPEEIIVVNLNNRKQSKEQILYLRQKLNELGVRSVSPGYVESSDVFKVSGCVTLATPFRAKGNESNIVFVFNSQKVVEDSSLRARNAFFASLTRSRGWCYITGNSPSMSVLVNELEQIKKDFPRLKFTRPSDNKIAYVRNLINSTDKELGSLTRTLDRLKGNPELLLQEIKNNPELLRFITDGLSDE